MDNSTRRSIRNNKNFSIKFTESFRKILLNENIEGLYEKGEKIWY